MIDVRGVSKSVPVKGARDIEALRAVTLTIGFPAFAIT